VEKPDEAVTGLTRPRLRVPDLDVPWRELEYCVVDVETTGLDLRRDRLISFGSVLVVDGRLRLSTGLSVDVRPAREISVAAMTVHGLRPEDLETAPPLDRVVDSIVSRLEGRVLVAHAAWIERAFLREPVRLAGRRWTPAVVDTAALLRATGVVRSGTGHEPDIEAVAEGLGLCVHTPHQALGDALTTAEVFLAMAARVEKEQAALSGRTLVDLSTQHSLA
jgi:DNA polymerase III subunit epsilon